MRQLYQLIGYISENILIGRGMAGLAGTVGIPKAGEEYIFNFMSYKGVVMWHLHVGITGYTFRGISNS